MSEWKGIVGLSYSPEEFETYLQGIQWTDWHPSFIVLHNTYSPTLAQRPNGLTHQHILNLVNYYRDEKGWKAGPHLFVDDKQIWVFTPLTVSGRHSPSWNEVSLGVEMLGDYDNEQFDSGRGLAVKKNAALAIASLTAALDIDPDTMRLHKEDTETTHHDCPGANVSKSQFIQAVKNALA